MATSDEQWCAILLAGQRPGPDPLASHFGQRYKALVPVGGAPMLDRVARCLLNIPRIAKVIVLAQEPELLIRGAGLSLETEARLVPFAGQSGIAESIRAVLRSGMCDWPVLVTTADHPLLTPEIISEFLAGADGGDLAVGVVEQNIVLRRYPETCRTWLRFAGGAYSGANLFALRTARVEPALDLWGRAERDRKQALKLFWHFGPGLALRAILRRIGFRDALARAGDRLGVDARLVELSVAEAAIDVDKLCDHQLVEHILSRRNDTRWSSDAGADLPAGTRAAGLPL